MATAKNNQNSSDIEEYLRDLLECPVCMETIKSVPVYQCANGHVICKDCIEKLNNCPICRNDSELRRSLKLENIVQRLEGIQPGNVGPTTATPNLQKWGKGSVRSYGTINGPNQEPRIEPNLQATPGLHYLPTYATLRLATPRQGTHIEPNLQATPGLHYLPTYATLRLAKPRQAAPRQATSNRDEESALLQGDMVENMTQSIKTFFKNVGTFIGFIIITLLAILGIFGLCVIFVLIIQLLHCGYLPKWETWNPPFWQC